MTRRVLVTGAGGFVGTHLVDLLARTPATRVFAAVRRRPDAADRWAGLPVELRPGDLTDASYVADLVCWAHPDWVIHLAAQPSVADSWRDPTGTLVNNLVAQSRLLEEVAGRVPTARVLVIGSSEEYGRVRPEDLPLTEAAPLRPDNPYAVSKVAQDYLGLQYYLGRNLAVIRARPFNLFGPGQSDRFAISSFARQIAEAEASLGPPRIAVGNLATRRDYTDVRDAVRAYHALLERGTPGEVYNVGGGGVHAIREILEALLGLARVAVAVVVDPSRFRPTDTPEVAPDVRRIHAATGWEPRIPFEQTVRDILDDWRSRVSRVGS